MCIKNMEDYCFRLLSLCVAARRPSSRKEFQKFNDAQIGTRKRSLGSSDSCVSPLFCTSESRGGVCVKTKAQLLSLRSTKKDSLKKFDLCIGQGKVG